MSQIKFILKDYLTQKVSCDKCCYKKYNKLFEHKTRNFPYTIWRSKNYQQKIIKLNMFLLKKKKNVKRRRADLQISLFLCALYKRLQTCIMIVKISRSWEPRPPSKCGDVEIAKSDNEGNVHSPWYPRVFLRRTRRYSESTFTGALSSIRVCWNFSSNMLNSN